ncbi:MAG: diaminopimelate epimerase [Kordiimonadaceae bacterium]|jgi:diaminopimelate epimerase|nr:diaminopimelate epimerase [Kordiimonadaceae bacterium]MBT6031564.1 diaminopimelate epimerase [Kordiimonadaceae bacterium]
MKNWLGIAPTGRPFVKMQGLRNHFVIVDGRTQPFKPSISEIVSICDIETGPGAEQLMVIEPVSDAGEGAYARVRIYNPDGEEAEACGNATRCVAKLLFEEAGLDEMGLEINFQILNCSKEGDNISVEMGHISFEWDKIPLAENADTLNVNVACELGENAVAVNVGNPHLVYFVEKFNSELLRAEGPKVQNNPLFPQSINVGSAEIIDDTHIKLQVWERPGMLTMGCGSGACAAVAAARARGYVHHLDFVYVEMPGGTLKITYKDNTLAVMSGPAEYCYSGYLTI